MGVIQNSITQAAASIGAAAYGVSAIKKGDLETAAVLGEQIPEIQQANAGLASEAKKQEGTIKAAQERVNKINAINERAASGQMTNEELYQTDFNALDEEKGKKINEIEAAQRAFNELQTKQTAGATRLARIQAKRASLQKRWGVGGKE